MNNLENTKSAKSNYNDKVHRINFLSGELDAIYHKLGLKIGIPDSVMRVLYVIYEKGNQCLLHDICKESGISKQTVNSALRKLEAEEILYLENYKGKSKRVYLTEKGKEYVKHTAALVFEAECNAFNDWTAEELDTYLSLMKKYNLSLSREIDKINT